VDAKVWCFHKLLLLAEDVTLVATMLRGNGCTHGTHG
jgi:hypothetical protein